MSKLSANLVAGVLIFVVAILGIFFINGASPSFSTGKVISTSESFCKEVEIPYVDTEVFTEQLSFQDCVEEPLAYSTENFQIISECLNFNEKGYCKDKNVYFFLDISNLAKEKGDWSINFLLYGDDELIYSRNQIVNLDPKEASKLSLTFSLKGVEESNKVISGEYLIKKEPTKKICSDQILYRNETRTINITKFRTEVKCF